MITMHSVGFYRFLKWKNGSKINQFIMAVLVTFPTLLVGQVMGWVSPTLPLLQSDDGPLGYAISDSDVSWLASITFLTSIPTMLASGAIVNAIGRKKTILIATASVTICWLIKLIWLKSLPIIIARAIAGIGNAIAYAIPPIYIKEISDPEIRGALSSFIILAQNLGIIIMYVLGDLLSYQTVLIIALVMSVLHFVVFLGAPESPSYLVKTGKEKEAIEILAWLQSKDTNDKTISEQIKEIEEEDAILEDSDDKPAWKIILTDTTVRKAFIICSVLLLSEEFSGYLIVLTYASDIFSEANIGDKLTVNQQAMLIGGVQLLGSIFASGLVEKTGRKYLFIATAFLTGLGMTSLATWFYVRSIGIWSPTWLPIAAMCLSMFCVAGGFQPLAFVVLAEMFNFKLRGLVTAITIALSALADFIQSMAYQSVTDAIGAYGTFYIFAVICFIGCIFALIFLPETKNKSLEEIYECLGEKKMRKSRIGKIPEEMQ